MTTFRCFGAAEILGNASWIPKMRVSCGIRADFDLGQIVLWSRAQSCDTGQRIFKHRGREHEPEYGGQTRDVVASQSRTTTKDAVQTTSKQREADALEDDKVREALKRLHARDNSG